MGIEHINEGKTLSGASRLGTGKDECDSLRSLLKMSSDYTLEYIWLMSQYKACRRENIEQLIRTPSMRALVSKDLHRLKELMEGFNA